MRRLIKELARAVALYSFAAWVYVAVVAVAQPQTLPLQLTHLASGPRTDTFGEASFAVSFLSYLLYRYLDTRE